MHSECNATSQTICRKCSECPVGYYMIKSCTATTDAVCAKCDEPCERPQFEGVTCSSTTNRVCVTPGAPVCAGGCGTGTCISDDVCRCTLPYYGANCEFNCHKTCRGYSATCEISPGGISWWCTCPTGFYPGVDGQQCYENLADYPQCNWQEWGSWSSCTHCGSVVVRQRVRGEDADAGCSQAYPEHKICDSDCMGLTFDQEMQILKITTEGTSTYAALSLYGYWSNEGARFVNSKYNVTLQLSDDPERDAFEGRFFLRILRPVDPSTKRQEEESECLENGEKLDSIVMDIQEQTTNFLVEVRNYAPEDFSVDMDECDMQVIINVPGDVYPAVIGGVLGGVIALLILVVLFFLWYMNRPLDLTSLPEPVRWQYEQYQSSSRGWSKLGGKKGKFYRKQLTPKSTEWEHMEELFYKFMKASESIEISEAYAIYNETLITSFINHRNIITTRMRDNPHLFNKDILKNKERKDRLFVHSKWMERVGETGWNTDEDVPIIPAIHGTDFGVAMAICSTGFASLSSLDAGYYGSGVYFTTYAMYTVPYFASRKDPAAVISYLSIGSAYPTTEHHQGPHSLMGHPLKSGFTGHYVKVTAEGTVPNYNEYFELVEKGADPNDVKSGAYLWDELVVAQESQITPVYVVRISRANLSKLMMNWDRDTERRTRDRKEKRSKSKSRLNLGKGFARPAESM
eukprot:TRINITY_DN1564_c0_g1_i6.p1 TRINITY_DN1564_c0_g1~~TRINITY_DN1564_c0_g1_i6.p1  ORF type:complete len:687 (-),score=134.25 TRINITY_DN1564_c0_g1_i6:237-2297(-)